MRTRRLSVLAVCVAASLVVLLAGCPFPKDSVKKASLTISINNNINARTLLPPISMDAASYIVEGAGPNGASFSQSSGGEPVTVEGLTFGTWTVTVSALNAEGTVIGQGQDVATLSVGQDTTLAITVIPLGGTGDLNLTVNWTASLQFPSIQASLVPPSGTATNLDFGISGNQANYSGTAIAAGYYTLTLQLRENNIPVMGAVEVVRIVSGQTTSGSYDFSNVNMGTIEVNITPAMANPIAVDISGVPATVAVGTSVTATASVSDGTANVLYVWYLNGVSQGTGESYSFGSTLNRGYYRLDVTAFTADGIRAGSATASFQVTKAGSGGSEYFVSFKFDGTPVTFTEGVLEWGNVALAAAETGWVHNGHVYDRTHISAAPVGRPMAEFPGDTSIDIALVGEPGTQPPPAGTYTFSDGVHEIHDLTYRTPGLNCSVYSPSGSSGSATVILTSVGEVGGFIEGTFSATVLEEGTRAPHDITEGAFHVKRIALAASYTLLGTFASPDGVTVPDGIYGYLKLVPNGGAPTDPALYWTRSKAFSGGSAGYSITGIAPGTYTAYAFIDMNANAPDNASAMPDSSDFYLQTGQEIAISGSQVLNLGPGGWITESSERCGTCVGTWVNLDYNVHGPAPKFLITTDRSAIYDNTEDTEPVMTLHFVLADDWTSGGAHYFKFDADPPVPSTPPRSFFLMRVRDNNTTLEMNGSDTSYPAFINTDDRSYGIYRRH